MYSGFSGVTSPKLRVLPRYVASPAKMAGIPAMRRHTMLVINCACFDPVGAVEYQYGEYCWYQDCGKPSGPKATTFCWARLVQNGREPLRLNVASAKAPRSCDLAASAAA